MVNEWQFFHRIFSVFLFYDYLVPFRRFFFVVALLLLCCAGLIWSTAVTVLKIENWEKCDLTAVIVLYYTPSTINDIFEWIIFSLNRNCYFYFKIYFLYQISHWFIQWYATKRQPCTNVCIHLLTFLAMNSLYFFLLFFRYSAFVFHNCFFVHDFYEIIKRQQFHISWVYWWTDCHSISSSFFSTIKHQFIFYYF